MSFNNNNSDGLGNLNDGLAYDLRQAYAKIVGEHLEDCARFRKTDNFPKYFESLKDLIVVTNHKFCNRKFKIKQVDGKDKDVKGADHVNKLLGDCAEVARSNPSVWTGTSQDAVKRSLIEQSLFALEMFLYQAIDEAGLFGIKTDDEGL